MKREIKRGLKSTLGSLLANAIMAAIAAALEVFAGGIVSAHPYETAGAVGAANVGLRALQSRGPRE